MSKCIICGETIPRGKSYKGEKYRSIKFCSKNCYDIYVQSKLKSTDVARKKFTDYINNNGSNINWPFLMKQAKSIQEDYDIDWNIMYLVLKYYHVYEGQNLDMQYGLGKIFPKFIEPTARFREKLAEAREKAEDMVEIEPIKVKKYQPQRKIKDDLTFD